MKTLWSSTWLRELEGGFPLTWVPGWFCRAPRGIPPSAPGRKPRSWRLQWSGNLCRASAASHRRHLWCRSKCGTRSRPEVWAPAKLEIWSTCDESVGGVSVVSHQREEGLPGHEGAEEERLHHLQVKIWNKRPVQRPHKRSEPRAPTQWRSFRDWVCGGPSCHQLKPREETTSVTFPTAFSRACLTSVAPSSDPAATTGGFQEDARAWEANQLSDVSEPLLCYRGTVHPIFNKRWPGFSRNGITGFTMWLFLHHKLFNKTLVWPESVGVQQYVWRCDKWSTNWLKKRVETESNAFKQSRSTRIPLLVSFPHRGFQDFTFSVTRLGLNWLFRVKNESI